MLKKYFLCLSFLLLVTGVVRCEADYSYNADAHGWVKIHTTPEPWEDAFLRCHSEGAVLASPINNQLATALQSLIAQSGVNSDFFLGTHALFDNEHFLSVEGVVRCEADYSYNADAHGWVKIHTTPEPWEDAFLRCHSEGAVLASPINNQLATALQSLIAQSGVNSDFFLGTHALFDNEHFLSVEGVPLSDMVVTMSSSASSTGDCLSMSADGRAYYSSCTNPLPYVCYKKSIPTECTYGYNFNRRTGSCYKVHTDKVIWDRAFSTCASEGGHLVILNNAEEASVIRSMFPENYGESNPRWIQFHIGLVAWGKNRTWMTIDGKDINDVFGVWDKGQPDNLYGIQYRATYRKTPGKLDDIDQTACHAMFVCEKAPTGNEKQIY